MDDDSTTRTNDCSAVAARFVRRADGALVRCRLRHGHDAAHDFLIEDGTSAVQWREGS